MLKDQSGDGEDRKNNFTDEFKAKDSLDSTFWDKMGVIVNY